MRLLWLIVASALVWPASAGAEINWLLSKKYGRGYLQGMPNESEVDLEFWAHCRTDGRIDVGMAAEANVGKGKGEAVTLTLTSAGQSTKVSGISRRSENFEMTSGVELRATVSRGDKLFAVLATGKPVAVTGPIEPLEWDVKGLKPKVAALIAGCGKKG